MAPVSHILRRFCLCLAALLLAVAGCVGIGPAGAQEADDRRASASPAPTGPSTRNVLAISWQPAFCETQPRREECRSQTQYRFDAEHFSLHGLWPQPRRTAFCGVSDQVLDRSKAGGWMTLDAPALGEPTRASLAKAMPGTMSGLDRYEWLKHGTCYGTSAEVYFSNALSLLAEVNASPVQTLFSRSIGKMLTAAEIRAAFDEGFGKGAGERVRIACRKDGGRQIIVELTLGLVGSVETSPDLKRLMLASNPTKAGCPEGIVDAVGTN